MKKIPSGLGKAAVVAMLATTASVSLLSITAAGDTDVAEPAPVSEVREPYEDEPGFDCRIHGNQMCGVQIADTWYVVTFRNGQPVTVAVR